MRAPDAAQTSLFTSIALADRVPARHPLRPVRAVAVAVAEDLRPALDRLYRPGGSRLAPPPEQILRALLLWSIYSLPSEMRLLEELDYNLLYRWFVGLDADAPVWRESTFRSNRRRILAAPVAGEFFARVFARLPPRLLPAHRFSVNWPLVDAWSGQRTLAEVAR